MQLKKIEMQGFKSFADKTTIEFTEGITAIVGPNGSGKSNIIEAIRWVMGEQSAKNLRGGKMPDIIFSGSDSRKPVNIAEVTLVLDNEDQFLPIEFEEVSITRRLHRNGTSDYYINKQACRLKDIVDLFMDSGLGKESFSVISQGQVEAVFNSKPEERRAIFEEAAGVLKYKNQKKKAEQKLEETKDNLDRVQDILYELNSQLEPLKKDSSIARSYLEQKEELTQLDIAVTAHDIGRLSQEIDETNQKLKDYEAETRTLQEEISAQRSKVNAQKKLEKEKEAKLEEVQQKRLSIVQAYERAEAESKLIDERSRYSAEQTERLQQTIEKLTSEKESLNEQIQTLEKELEENRQKQKEQNTEIHHLEQQRDRLEGNKEAVMEELRDEYIDAMQRQSALNNELSYIEKTLLTEHAQLEKLTKEFQEVEAERKTIRSQIEDVSSQLRDTKTNITQLLDQYKQVETEYKRSRVTLDKQENTMQEASRILQGAKAKRSSLQELQDNYAGYFQGVREVMNRSNQLNGIVGTVAELVEVPKEYQLAVDTALGTSSQFIIVENEESGRQAIDFLKQHHKGRATFLPLTAIRPRRLPNDVQRKIGSAKGFLGVASELVSFDHKIESVIENLLGNTIVTDTLESAVHIAKRINHRYRIVSLDGDVMNAGGSMTGGARKKSSSIDLFSQKNELKSLDTQIHHMEQTLADKEKNIQQLRETCGKQALELEELKEAGESERWKEQQLQNRLESCKEKKSQLEKQWRASQFERTTAEEEIESNQHRKEKGMLELEQTKQLIQSLKEEMNTVSEKWDNREKEKQRLAEKVRSFQEVLYERKEEAAGIRKEITVLNKQETTVHKELEEAQESFELLTAPVSDSSKEETKMTLQEMADEKEKLEKKQTDLRNEREQLQASLQDAESLLTNSQHKLQSLQTVKSKSEVEVNRKDVQLDYLLDYLSEEYKISYEEAKRDAAESDDLDGARKKVRLLKKGIEELGSVNLGAIDEYEKVSSRWEFLTKQQNDLLDAKDSLHETMDEMDQEVSKRFKETFEQIQEQFAIVFPRMFGGGKAELLLTDPEDYLHSGVDIVAQPPGKKLQHLSLLSGGERALTAISLLFAIIQVRPIPFCILDEAEAALDEANVIRFSRYLHTFEGEIQFIVITHRKGTMEEADNLYGVTMQEKGVSNLVSVSLKEAEERIATH